MSRTALYLNGKAVNNHQRIFTNFKLH